MYLRSLLTALVFGALLLPAVHAQRVRGSNDRGATTRPKPRTAPRPSRPSISRPSIPRTTRPTYRPPSRPSISRPSIPRSTPRPSYTPPSRPSYTRPTVPTPKRRPTKRSTDSEDLRRSNTYTDRVPTRPTTGWKTLTPKKPDTRRTNKTDWRRPLPRTSPPVRKPSKVDASRPSIDRSTKLTPRAPTRRPTITRKYPPVKKVDVTTKPTVRPKVDVRPLDDVRPKPVRPKVKPRTNPGRPTGSDSDLPKPGAVKPVDGPKGGGNADVVNGATPADVLATKGAGGNRDLFALNLYHSSGSGTSVSLFAGNINQPASPYGASPYHYGHGNSPYWACGYNPWYGGSYWNNTWYSPCYSYGYPWYIARYGGIFRFAWHRYRWSFGFGYSYSPFYASAGYYGGNYYRSYPYYRTYAYYPYSYYNTVAYYPAYSTIYHSAATVDYADASDPYVEFVDSVPEAAPLAPPVPEAFAKPLVTEFPEGLSPAELLVRGATWMKDGEHLLAAEAFRRAWLSDSGDAFSPLKLSLALFGAGGRYGLAGFALHESLDRDATSIPRHPALIESFKDAAVLGEAVNELKRHVVKNPTDGEGRFLLGAVLLWSEDPFASRNEFSALREGEWKSPHVEPFLEEAEKRLLADR